MTYSISLHKERALQVLIEMKESAKLISAYKDSDGKEWITLEITISSSYDVILLIHAGIHIGQNETSYRTI